MKYLATIAAAFALLTTPIAAEAAQVTPMVLTLDEIGRGATGRIEWQIPALNPYLSRY